MNSPQVSNTSSKGERLRIGALIAVTVLVYANTLVNGFTFDDNLYIFRTPVVSNFSVDGLFEPHRANNVLRPLTFATLALNWFLGGAHAFGYHLFNLLVHVSVVILLYLVFQRLLESVPEGTTVAFVASLLFAVHPIHTEAVAWISGRSELLAAMLLLSAWLLHINDWQILSLFSLLLALMAKESSVVFLPLVLAGDYARGKLKPLRRYVYIGCVAAIYLALFWKIEGGRFGEKGVSFMDNPLASLPLALRIPNALRIAWKYLGLLIYPRTLSSDYSYNSILLYSNWRHNWLPVTASLAVVVLWIWTIWKRKTSWFLAGAIYFGAFSVTANLLIPTGTIMGERLAYLPSAGFCLLVALLWSRLEKREKTLAWILLGVLVVPLAARTVTRNQDWHDNGSLFLADLKSYPRNAKLHNNVGVSYYMKRGQFDDARREFQTALRIYPEFPEALEAYGLVEVLTGNNQHARELLEKSLAMTGKDDINYYFRSVYLAAVLIKLGENEEALKLLNQEIAESPGYSLAWSNRAVIRYQQGDTVGARSDAETAFRLDPGNSQAREVLAMLNNASGNTSAR